MNGNTFYFEWEVALIEWLQSTLGTFGEKAASILAHFGEEMILVALIGFTYWCLDKKFGRYLGVSICLGITSNALVKNIFFRRRPYFDNPGIKCVRAATPGADAMDISAQGFSFPSGHSTNAVSAYVGMGAYLKKKAVLFAGITFSLLIGISRLVLGVHYPTDVIVGLALGAVVAIASSYLLNRVKKHWILYLVLFVFSCIGFFYCKSEDYYSSIGIMGGFFLGDLFEGKYVNFENTKVWYKCMLRLIGGFALFFGLNFLCKLPFSKEFLESGSFGAYVARSVRYLICTFVIIGAYPILFNKFSKVF